MVKSKKEKSVELTAREVAMMLDTSAARLSYQREHNIGPKFNTSEKGIFVYQSDDVIKYLDSEIQKAQATKTSALSRLELLRKEKNGQ